MCAGPSGPDISDWASALRTLITGKCQVYSVMQVTFALRLLWAVAVTQITHLAFLWGIPELEITIAGIVT